VQFTCHGHWDASDPLTQVNCLCTNATCSLKLHACCSTLAIPHRVRHHRADLCHAVSERASQKRHGTAGQPVSKDLLQPCGTGKLYSAGSIEAFPEGLRRRIQVAQHLWVSPEWADSCLLQRHQPDKPRMEQGKTNAAGRNASAGSGDDGRFILPSCTASSY